MAIVEEVKPSQEEKKEVDKILNSKYSSGIHGAQYLLTFFILASAWVVAFFSRLFAVVRFESIIHEFDPWLVFSLDLISHFTCFVYWYYRNFPGSYIYSDF